MTFTLRPTNDATAEGEETISVSGDTAGLTVVPAELVLADNDAVSTRLSLSLRPDFGVSEGAAPTDVTVTGTAGCRGTGDGDARHADGGRARRLGGVGHGLCGRIEPDADHPPRTRPGPRPRLR